MKLINLLSLAFLLMFAAACGSNEAHDHDHEDGEHADHEHGEEQIVSTTDSIHYGEMISEEGAIEYSELLTRLQTEKEIENVTVVAVVGEVCQVKGCWMNITDGTVGGEEAFVQFKDYGFFMPKDLAGQKVAIQGKAYYETTSVEDLKHYAEDKKATKEEIDAITEPKVELKFLASGVKILPTQM